MKKTFPALAALVLCSMLFLATQPVSAAVWEMDSGTVEVWVDYSDSDVSNGNLKDLTISYETSDGDFELFSGDGSDTFTSNTTFEFYLTTQTSDTHLYTDIYEYIESDDVYILTWNWNTGNEGVSRTATYIVAGASPVPVPTAALLLGSGIIGLVSFRRRFGK